MALWRDGLYPPVDNREVMEAAGMGIEPHVVSLRELASLAIWYPLPKFCTFACASRTLLELFEEIFVFFLPST